MDSSAELVGESAAGVSLCRLERHSSTSACGSQDTSQGWFTEPSSYSEEETDFLNEVLLYQDTATDASRGPITVTDNSALRESMSGLSTTSSDVACEAVVPKLGASQSTVSILQTPVDNPPLKLQLNYSDVMRTWEQLVTQKKSAGPVLGHIQPEQNHFSAIRSTQYQMPYGPSYSSACPTSFGPSCLTTAMSADSVTQHQLPYSYLYSNSPEHMTDRCMSLPVAPMQTWSHQTAGGQQLQDSSMSLERYRVQKATRPSTGPTARPQLCKVKTERARQGPYANTSKLAELQLEAALSAEYASATSPMLSGGSCTSAFL